MRNLFLITILSLAAFGQTDQAGRQFFQAACNGDMLGVENGLRNHVPVDWKSPEGYTALLCAAKDGQLPVVKYLVANGAQINKRDNGKGKTPLLAAAFQSQLGVVEYLISQHAALDIQANNRWTALHDAAFVGSLPVVRALASAGASRHLVNELGETPVQTALRAYNLCKNRNPNCASARGDSKATVAQYKATWTYLRGLN